MLPVPDQDPRRPGRRLFLVGVGTVVLAPLSGCGIRLEDDAPRVPLVPVRTPVAGEELLTALTRECDRLAAMCARAPGGVAGDLRVLHARQHTVLRTALLREGVPEDALDEPVAGPSPGATVSPAPVTVAALGSAEALSAAGAARFSVCAGPLRVSVAALHAQRFAAATLLGGTVPRVAGAAPTGAVVDGVVTATDAAVYLAEVGTARSDGARRKRAAATLAALRALRNDLVAGGDPPSPVLGVPLPFAVRTGTDVDRLFRETLTTLRSTLGSSLDALLTVDAAAGLPAATRWLGAVEVEAHRWGVPLAPFPGLA